MDRISCHKTADQLAGTHTKQKLDHQVSTPLPYFQAFALSPNLAAGGSEYHGRTFLPASCKHFQAMSANLAAALYRIGGTGMETGLRILARDRNCPGTCPCFWGRTPLGSGDEPPTVSATGPGEIAVVDVPINIFDGPPGVPCQWPGGPGGSARRGAGRAGEPGTALSCRNAAADGLSPESLRHCGADTYRGFWLCLPVQPLDRPAAGGFFSGSTG